MSEKEERGGEGERLFSRFGSGVSELTQHDVWLLLVAVAMTVGFFSFPHLAFELARRNAEKSSLPFSGFRRAQMETLIQTSYD